MNTNYMKKRIIMCITGVLTCGMAVGLFKAAAFGVDPFQSFMSGLNAMIPISFGTLYIIVNAILLSFSFFADKHYINIATLINLFLLGYVVEFSYGALQILLPDPNLIVRFLLLVIGIAILCFGSSLYFVADLGVSTYDAISLILANTWHVAKFKYCRIVSDIICVLIGAFLYYLGVGSFTGLGAIIGAGTIITAFFMGPLIDYFIQKIARPLLEK